MKIFLSDSYNQSHGRLEKVMEKVMESHGISRAQKSTNPVLYETETSLSIMTLTGYFFVSLVSAPVASQPSLFEQSKLTCLKMAFV